MDEIDEIEARKVKEAKEAKVARNIAFVTAKRELQKAFDYVKREDNDPVKYSRYNKKIFRLKKTLLIFDISHSTEKKYACRIAFAKKRPRVRGRFVSNPIKKQIFKKYARRERPPGIRIYARLGRPPLGSRNSSQDFPVSRKNNHHENEFSDTQALLALFTDNIKSNLKPKPLLPNLPPLPASTHLNFSALESLDCYFLLDPHLNEQMYDVDWFSNSQMFPSVALSAVSSILNLNYSESSYFDFLHEQPPKDQKHNENTCNLEDGSPFDSDIDMPYDFQLDPMSWGENVESEVPVSDSTVATKYADALARYGVLPAPSWRDKETIKAKIRDSSQEITITLER